MHEATTGRPQAARAHQHQSPHPQPQMPYEPQQPTTRGSRHDERQEAAAHGWVSVRNAAIMRMRRMGTRHVSLAVEPPRGRVPGPHALAFLYTWETAGSTAQRPNYDVGAATRAFDDGEETSPGHNVRDLAALLYGLWDVAGDRIAEGDFDPRRSMADRSDNMPSAASFVGIGVCSLGQPNVPWPAARVAAMNAEGLAALNMPSTWRIRLIDGTRIEVYREPGNLQEDIRSSAALDPPGFAAYGYVQRWRRLPEEYQPVQGSVDHALDVLVLAVDDGTRQPGPTRGR